MAIERTTRQREAVKDAVIGAGRPVLPSEILAAARKSVRTINLSTVYRAIKSLAAEGVIHAVEIPGEPPRYEAGHLEHHHHFRCDQCDRVFDVPGCHATHIDTHLPAGFRVRAHEVVLYGTCAACVQAGPREKARRGSVPGAPRKRTG